MLFENDIFSPHAQRDPRATAILRATVDRAPLPVQPLDFLAAAVDCDEPGVSAVLTRSLEPECTLNDLRELLQALRPRRSQDETRFDGLRSRFAASSLVLLADFELALQGLAEGDPELGAELLLLATLRQLDEAALNNLSQVLSIERCKRYLDTRTQVASQLPEPLFETSTGRLRSEVFSAAAWAVLERCGVRAASLGYDRILAPHVFLGLLEESEGITEWVVRLQASPEAGPAKVGLAVADALRLGEPKPGTVGLTNGAIGESCRELLQRTQLAARVWSADRIEPGHLLVALLEGMPARLATVLQGSPLNLDLAKMAGHVNQALAEAVGKSRKEVAFRLPAALLPSEDLTYQARVAGLPVAVVPEAALKDEVQDPYVRAMRALHRKRCNHLLVTGARGVGKTTFVRELARRANEGGIPFLSQKRFLWVDTSDVPPAESLKKFEAILAQVSGRTDLIVCLDGLGALLRAESGCNNKLLLRAALKDHRLHLIGIVSSSDFEDLIAADPELLEFFTRVEIEEPPNDAAQAMVGQALEGLIAEFALVVEPDVVQRCVVLMSEYIMSERLPSKAIKLLRRICEDLEFDRLQRSKAVATLTVANVVSAVSQISGVPEETLAGVAQKADYAKGLADQVIGQVAAVRAVADELGKIKMGLKDPGKPASVMLFAGLTGTGKTELAKTIARLYSSSKRLQTYAMGNYTESHSVSAFVGSPPGYHGHDQGGRLINELNADPYCVFLLDEAEKAHPDIWKPFLNLFDEGWIADQRGVKAFGNRAIFILTSNAGAAEIARLSRNRGADDVADRPGLDGALRKALLELRHQRSGEPAFAPEFLARITKLIAFEPLDEPAMRGICDKIVTSMQKTWLGKRGKTLEVPESLKDYVARRSALENADGTQGGRIVAKLLSDLVDSSIQQEAMRAPDEFANATRIQLVLTAAPDVHTRSDTVRSMVHVLFSAARSESPADALGRAIRRLETGSRAPAVGVGALAGVIKNCIADTEAAARLAGLAPEHEASARAAQAAKLQLERALLQLREHEQHWMADERQVLLDLVGGVRG